MDISDYLKWTETKLVDALEKANEVYRNDGKPILTDDEYDVLKERLYAVNPDNLFLKKVGANVQNGVKLPFIMASLDKIKDDPKALLKFQKKYEGSYVVSDKLDGNSGGLTINLKGETKLFSRGNGSVGQDLSKVLEYIKGVPILKEAIQVRGELIISKANWETIKGVYTNARNTVAGMLNSKTLKPEILKLIDFVAYELITPKMTPSEGLAYLKLKQFNVVDYRVVDTLNFNELSQQLLDRRKNSEYECDGIVIVHNAIHNMSNTVKNPSWGFAMKSILMQEKAEVVVTNVEWNASKDGVLKPIVQFNPVVLSGATISKATGFNAAFIETNKIGIGSRIIIIRSGDVIPYITEIVTKTTALFPKTEYKWNSTHVDISTVGRTDAQDVKELLHFVKKLEIKGVGPGVIQKLYDGGINSVPKLINVTVEELLKLEGFKVTSATNVAKALNSVRNIATCLTLAVASNIFGAGFGNTKLKLVFERFPEIEKRTAISVKEVASIEGVGEKTAEQFITALPNFYKFLDTIEFKCRVKSIEKKPNSKKTYNGVIVVFTGVRDKELEKLIEETGGKVATAVSSKTTHVVAKDVNDKTGKIAKAFEINEKGGTIKIMSLEEFKSN